MTAAKVETKGLHAKLAEVMAEVERIPKNGKAPAEMGGFQFVQVGDAADHIRKALGQRGVSMLPTAVEVTGQSEHEGTNRSGTPFINTTLDLRVTWTLTDGETGQTAVIQSIGAGADRGDKYTGKAMSNAMKYALLMGFLLSTGEDPELSNSEERGRKPEAKPGEESLHLLGEITRTGAVAKGDGRHSSLEPRQTPDGYVVGFRLELGGGKSIPQVVADGALGSALLVAMGSPADFLGTKVTATGRLYEVRAPQRKSTHRLVLTKLVTDEWTLPADIAKAPDAPAGDAEEAAPPVEAPSMDLFSPEEQARIDSALADAAHERRAEEALAAGA